MTRYDDLMETGPLMSTLDTYALKDTEGYVIWRRRLTREEAHEIELELLLSAYGEFLLENDDQ